MDKPVLVIMAAGMGSRYGGLKQIDPVGKNGEVIMDYSVYDALRAGFDKIIFVIKHEIEKDFIEAVGSHIAKVTKVEYAFQQLQNLPTGYSVPQGREKPWGTAQAVLSAKDFINGPFAVINADDYYGPEAFKLIYDYLCETPDADRKYNYAMVGYHVENTLTENGYVARGVCETDKNGFLQRVTERTHIEKSDSGAHFTEDSGESWIELPNGTFVSMNMWGFSESFLDEAERRFPMFLDKALIENPLKGEYFLPSVVSELISERKAVVKVLPSADKWYGVTYAQDKPTVIDAIEQKHRGGIYPVPLWKNTK
ncbi:MAG: sugar phosphate nucleotidyltransferase [Oscillospiraceae bacterium]